MEIAAEELCSIGYSIKQNTEETLIYMLINPYARITGLIKHLIPPTNLSAADR